MKIVVDEFVEALGGSGCPANLAAVCRALSRNLRRADTLHRESILQRYSDAAGIAANRALVERVATAFDQNSATSTGCSG